MAIPAALVFQPLLAPVRHEVRRMAGYRTPVRFSLTPPLRALGASKWMLFPDGTALDDAAVARGLVKVLALE